jgi:CDP-glucose 4,6-dehydratase
MVLLTRLDGRDVLVNDDLVVTVERTPDTVLQLITGDRIVVREPLEEVEARVARFRARASGRTLAVRNPTSTRPWQHVLEPLSGYLWLGACLASPSRARVAAEVASGFNFGPRPEAVRTVGELTARFAQAWPDLRIESGPAGPHEAARLSLAITKAERVLGWRPVWDFDTTVRKTADWISGEAAGGVHRRLCADDLAAYAAAAGEADLAWTR